MKRLIVFMLTAIVSGFSQPKQVHPQLLGTQVLSSYQTLNINNITTWIRSDGQSNHTPSGGDGVRYPRGTSWAVYQDGLLWAGKVYLDSGYTQPAQQTIRVGGQMYNVGTQPGWVTGFGATAAAVDPNDPRARVYRIRRDHRLMSTAELMRDASEFFELHLSAITTEHISRIREQYQRDWDEWPVDLGAPYIERNGIPGYQPPPPSATPFELIANNYDEPGVSGGNPDSPADQVIWVVCNDLDANLLRWFTGCNPMGLEVQITVWGYAQQGPLGQMYFKRVRLINKGGVITHGTNRGAFWIDSMFISQWTDPDIGSFGDDLVGCDSTRSLGFAYNGSSTDREYQKFRLPPPAVGYALLAGPVVQGTPPDSALYNFAWVYGKRNLPMTSFAWNAAGIGEPPTGYELALRLWRQIQGYLPDPSTSPWRLYPHPPGVEPTKFPLAGDPVTRTGHIDGLGTTYSWVPGDRRFMVNSGPFRLAPGDTQEVMIATIGGLGADYLSGITAVKFYQRLAQSAARSLFQTATVSFSPALRATELNGEIVLDWGSDSARIHLIEEYPYGGGYRFEGYAVYQLPADSTNVTDRKLLATFDVPNGIGRIIDEAFDPSSGLVVPSVLFYGSDSGIQRHLRITSDAFTGQPLRNGRTYRFAVTAYVSSSATFALPRAVESYPSIVTVKPRIPFGARPLTQYADTLPVQHSAGRSDGTVQAIVVDPLRGNGNTYEVRFDTLSGQTFWSLYNVTRGTTVLSRQRNFSDDNSNPTVEGGIILKVIGVPRGLKPDDELSTTDTSRFGWRLLAGSRRVTWLNGNLGLEGFRGAAGATSPYTFLGPGVGQPHPVPAHRLRRVHVHFANASGPSGTFDPNEPNVSYAYRYGRNFSAPPARPEFEPFMINRGPGYAYQDYTRSVPLAVYDATGSPPRRLAVGFLENNAPGGTVDGRYWPPPPSISNALASGPREWLFVFDSPYSDAVPDASLQADILNTPLPVMYMITWGRTADDLWRDGDILALIPYYVLTPDDLYQYTVPAPDTSLAQKKASAERVGVFPNPYYADGSRGFAYQGRFVTFNNLPAKTTVRILNLAGHVVRTLRKDDPSQFLVWDLKNTDGWLVASGMYLCHVEMPEIGATKVLKLAVIQEAVIPQPAATPPPTGIR